ncbi:probable pectinesterase 55 [Impatiens glandulifera]|uniref:probable pectinesterase 55 n=1 Tax=Impatiens glandulifera TaxID=253017 RepID=UPI001FB093C9|nr:probable pectinesterase 55 [Impatiens glandulifera]
MRQPLRRIRVSSRYATQRCKMRWVLVLAFFISSNLAYNFTSTVVVDKSGKGQFKTIQSAINSVPDGNNKCEKVSISAEKEYIFLDGSSSSRTIISWDDHQSTGTSATFSSSANNFVAKGITFVNSYNIKQTTKFAPALAVILSGDKAAFYNCGFIGFQDTLCDLQGRHYFRSCYIEGVADFIWGYGQSVYKNCNIKVNGRGAISLGYITAQGRGSAQDSNGFVFEGCNIGGIGKAYLGRAYGSFSRVVFINSTFSSVVTPLGWDNGFHPGEERNFTYVEAGCQGIGANTSNRGLSIFYGETVLPLNLSPLIVAQCSDLTL